MHSHGLRVLVLLCIVNFVNSQTLTCNLLSDGCDGGTTHNAAMEGAIARFGINQIYGGVLDTFSTFLDGDYLAQISYSCLDGSIPPALSGLTTQNLLNQLLTCPNQCGSVSLPGNNNCGFASLIVDTNNEGGCFSLAENLVPASGLPSEEASSGTFQSRGCWSDSTSARTLTSGSATANDMSVEKCVSLASGFRYAGVEYSTECYWGNEIQATSTSSTGSCNMPCSGSPLELCGGGNLINIYEDTSLTPIPSVIPSVGSFTNTGCYTDSTSSRTLVVDSSVDFSATGMTVEKCIAFAKSEGAQYAGVEYYGECYIGNQLHGTTKAANSDCNTNCAGNPSEFCGGSNRLQIYQDSTWKDPTLADLNAALLAYNDTLYQIQSYIIDYQNLLQEWQNDGGSVARRLVQWFRSVTKRGVTLGEAEDAQGKLTDIYTGIQTRRSSLVSQGSTVNREVQIAANLDIPSRATTPALTDASDVESTAELIIPDSALQTVEESAQSDIESVTDYIHSYPPSIVTSTTGLLGGSGGRSAIQQALGIIGTPKGIVAGVVGSSGLFLIVDSLYNKLNPYIPPVQSTIPPASTPTTTTTSTTTTTCSPTLTPTPMVVLTAQDTSDTDYNALLQLIPKENLVQECSYPDIGFRAFLAELDECQADTLEGQSSVVSVSLDAIVSSGANDEGWSYDPSTTEKRAETTRVSEDWGSVQNISSRLVSPDTTIMLQYPSPMHLQWLSATWAKAPTPTLSGTYYNIDGYLYDYRPNPVPVWVYIFDTGIYTTNIDFSDTGTYDETSKVISQYNARTNLEAADTDTTGHGTAMAGCAAGMFSGVAKDAKLVSVHVDEFTTGLRNSTTWDYIRGFAWACNNVKGNSMQGSAVFSMSWGVELTALDYNPSRPGVKTPSYRNPFIYIFQAFIFPSGIVAVAASSNEPTDDLALQEPTARGGASEGLIVVGNADWTGARYPSSSILDSSNSNILSIYANGVDVCSARRNAPNDFFCKTGTSPATAQVAGLAAYYLADLATRNEIVGNGLPSDWGMVSQKMKDKLIKVAKSRKGDTWTDQVPRAAMDEEYDCTPSSGAAAPANLPSYTPPVSEGPYLYLAEYPALHEPGDDSAVQLSAALHYASINMERLLDTPPDPTDPGQAAASYMPLPPVCAIPSLQIV